MPAGDLEAALRAVERQAAAMQAIERRIAEAAKKRRAAADGCNDAMRSLFPKPRQAQEELFFSGAQE
jgi:hypothetical protein